MDYRQLFRQMGFISRQAMLEMNQQASQFGLENNLFLLLTRIVEQPGLNQSQLAQLVQMDKTTLSRSLRKLEERQLLVKKVKSQNKKFKELYPTSQALRLYDQIIGFETSYIQTVMKDLSSSQLFQLQEILDKMTSSTDN